MMETERPHRRRNSLNRILPLRFRARCRFWAGLVSAAALGSPALGSTAMYEVVFDATWSAATHPGAYPSNAHFSPLVGATHDGSVSFWSLGEIATDGIEVMAERGRNGPLNNEVSLAISEAAAFLPISGGGTPSPGTERTTFRIADTHPLVSLVTMVAPSPDWFVGVSGLSLRENGEWIESLVVELPAYDAGTDSGAEFRSPNADVTPHVPITLLDDPFTGLPPLGTFTFSLLPEPEIRQGDYNGNGTVEQADLDLVLNHWGEDAAAAPETWAFEPPTAVVDQNELDGVLLNWGNTVGTVVSSAAVPEPQPLLLALLSISGILAGRVRGSVQPGPRR